MPAKPKPDFCPDAFLSESGMGRVVVEFRKRQIIFRQGDPGSAAFFIQKGTIKLTVLSKEGKEATIAILSTGDFAGEECIAGINSRRLASATAVTDCSLLRIERKEMIRVLHEEHTFSDTFVSYLLARNTRIQADLIDQLFNSSEKRLARALLLLAQFGKTDKTETVIPKISQDTLAEMIGTTRSRVNFFMNRFRKLGFIEYNGTLKIHGSLLSIVLHQ